MQLKTILERSRRALGIDSLLPMQDEMARTALPARVLLQAPTGSGKTLAFAIALLRSMSGPSGEGVKALVIAPTRELVLQIYDTVRPLAAPDYKTTALYGGHSFETEAKSLAANPDIVVGTPGRLLDHINRRRPDQYQDPGNRRVRQGPRARFCPRHEADSCHHEACVGPCADLGDKWRNTRLCRQGRARARL